MAGDRVMRVMKAQVRGEEALAEVVAGTVPDGVYMVAAFRIVDLEEHAGPLDARVEGERRIVAGDEGEAQAVARSRSLEFDAGDVAEPLGKPILVPRHHPVDLGLLAA